MVSYLAEAPEEVVRYTSIVRAVEAAGGAVASGISSTTAPLTVAVGVNFGVCAVAVIPAWLVVRRIGNVDLPQFGGVAHKVELHA
ncbi:hypothetical protein CPB85DRAFT_104976 [Mucidula mucida]|nr:hypothetical protein CPB85DRAFT_104976 [Mucidula mucida]